MSYFRVFTSFIFCRMFPSVFEYYKVHIFIIEITHLYKNVLDRGDGHVSILTKFTKPLKTNGRQHLSLEEMSLCLVIFVILAQLYTKGYSLTT